MIGGPPPPPDPGSKKEKESVLSFEEFSYWYPMDDGSLMPTYNSFIGFFGSGFLGEQLRSI